MLFHEYTFLFLFLPLTLATYFALPSRARNSVLLAASVLFYAVSSLFYAPLLATSTIVDYFVGGRIADSRRVIVRRALLALSIAINLGLLGFFKYAGFLTGILRDELGFSAIPILDVALPVGISFYTFQSMSYSIDVYRGEASRSRSLVDFSTFVALFPQLIAGPIVRYREIEAQLTGRKESAILALSGANLFILGLAKKLLLADTAATIADPIFAGGPPSTATAWVAVLAYAAQIYFDFSGYSDMARGLGRVFGFDFPVNFNSPYKATSFRDFWHRWHMTLSRWLRDNLYIPLGGSRFGVWRTSFALSTTMLLGGLWHGASWNFVVWGGLHGVFLAVERLVDGAEGPRGPPWLRRSIVFLGVVSAWAFFRVDGFQPAVAWLGAMAGLGSSPAAPSAMDVALLLPILGIAFVAPNSDEFLGHRSKHGWIVSALLFAASLLVGYGRGVSPFLYFRF